jgi:hypothetical protein
LAWQIHNLKVLQIYKLVTWKCPVPTRQGHRLPSVEKLWPWLRHATVGRATLARGELFLDAAEIMQPKRGQVRLEHTCVPWAAAPTYLSTYMCAKHQYTIITTGAAACMDHRTVPRRKGTCRDDNAATEQHLLTRVSAPNHRRSRRTAILSLELQSRRAIECAAVDTSAQVDCYPAHGQRQGLL